MNFEIVMSALVALSAIAFIWKVRSWRKSVRKHKDADAARLRQEQALEFLRSLRPISGTDPDFDYEKGEPKS